MRTVAILALESVIGFELTIPCEVFGKAGRPSDNPDSGSALYDVRVCGLAGGDAVNGFGNAIFGMTAPHAIAEAENADIVIVPGVSRYLDPPPAEVVDLLRRAHERGARVASICTGAFTLAAAGLLDGQRATTHWAVAPDLARAYPRVQVDPAVLYVDNDGVLTSAGMAAGLDMCLHMVRRDYGAGVAADLARLMVVQLERDGGQAQFITHQEPPTGHDGLRATMVWMQERLDRPPALVDIARHANISVRTLNRRFQELTGTTPLRWLTRQRLYRAQQLLETTPMSVEEVARRSGFGTAVALRQHFNRTLSTAPLAYRKAFQSAAQSS
jgi:transcriptional regulator GlxA family with amidase domain